MTRRKTPRARRERKPWHERMADPSPEHLRREGEGFLLFVLILWVITLGGVAVRWLMTHR